MAKKEKKPKEPKPKKEKAPKVKKEKAPKVKKEKAPKVKKEKAPKVKKEKKPKVKKPRQPGNPMNVYTTLMFAAFALFTTAIVILYVTTSQSLQGMNPFQLP